MTYRKEILEAVEEAFDYVRDDYLGVPLANEAEWEALKQEAVSLLKEQEPVKPKGKVRHGANVQIQHFCGNCNSMLHGKPKYCPECGKAVKWDG